MSTFSKTLQDKDGSNINVFIEGTTGTNNERSKVDLELSQPMIGRFKLSGWKRQAIIHNHPNGTSFSYSINTSKWGGEIRDINIGLRLNTRLYLSYQNYRGRRIGEIFYPNVYRQWKNDSTETYNGVLFPFSHEKIMRGTKETFSY